MENSSVQLKQLIEQLRSTPKTAAVLFTEHRELWQQLNFTQAQVSLWRASLPLNVHCHETSPVYQSTPDLGQHLIDLLTHSGGRMPLAQVMKKLPAGITTTEQQIRKLAQQHAQLEIKGPLLVLAH